MTARRAGIARRGAGLVAIAIFLVTAARSIARMGPLPDGTCAMAPTCPNSHQWVALLGVAVVCVALALLTLAAVSNVWRRDAETARSHPRSVVAIGIAVAVALALLLVDPPGHLNSSHASWFGHSLGDASLN